MAIERKFLEAIHREMARGVEQSEHRADLAQQGNVDELIDANQQVRQTAQNIATLTGLLDTFKASGIEDLPIEDSTTPAKTLLFSGNGDRLAHSSRRVRLAEENGSRPIAREDENGHHGGNGVHPHGYGGNGAAPHAEATGPTPQPEENVRLTQPEIPQNIESPTARIGYESLRLNEDGSAFKNAKKIDVINAIYGSTLNAIEDPDEKKKKMRQYDAQTTTAWVSIEESLKNPTKRATSEVKAMLGWIRNQPLAQKLSINELIQLLRRRSDSSEIYKKAGLKEPAPIPKATTEKSGNSTNAVAGLKKERAHKLFDLTEWEEKTLRALLEINPDNSAFSNLRVRDVANALYAEELGKLPDERQKNSFANNKSGAVNGYRDRIVVKLTEAFALKKNIPERLKNSIEWIRSIPQYVNLTAEQIVAVVKREITFAELKALSSQPNPDGDKGADPKAGSDPDPKKDEGNNGDEKEVLDLAELFNMTSQIVLESKEGRDLQFDLTLREEKLAIACLDINADKDGFSRPTVADIIREIYVDEFYAGLSPREKQKKEDRAAKQFQEDVDNIVNKVEYQREFPTSKQPYAKALSVWIAMQPELAKLEPRELQKVMLRKIPFTELKRRIADVPAEFLVYASPVTPV